MLLLLLVPVYWKVEGPYGSSCLFVINYELAIRKTENLKIAWLLFTFYCVSFLVLLIVYLDAIFIASFRSINHTSLFI